MDSLSSKEVYETVKEVITNRNILGIALTTSMWSLVQMGWYPFWSAYMVDYLGASVAVLGIFSAISTSQNLLFQLPGGILADRYGRKKIIVAGTFLRVFSPIIYYFATTWQWVVVGAVIDGFASLYMPAFSAIIADSLPQKRRGAGYGAYNMITTLPSMFAPVIGGIAMEKYGYQQGIRMFLIIQSVVGLLMTLLRWYLLKETVDIKPTGKRPSLFLNKKTIDDLPKTIQIMLVVAVIGSFSGRLVWDYTNLYALKVLMLTPTQLGLITTVVSGLSAVLALPGGMLSDRFGRKNNIMLGRTVAPISQGLISIAAGYEQLFAIRIFNGAAIALGGSGMDYGGPSWNALIADIVPPEKRATVLGSMGTVTALAGAPSGPLGGWLWANISPQAPFQVSMVIGLISAAIFWVGVHEPGKDKPKIIDKTVENETK
ncbi:MAG: MFS transporter [Candidatus Bathyarchaeota archaeon]|nr:MFS transporter [Candidatus Bathyarchaeota archaeon]